MSVICLKFIKMAGSHTRRINLYINGKEVKNDIASIKAEMQKLANEQAHLTRESREYIETGKKIKMLKGIIQEHNQQLQAVSKSWNLENISFQMNKHFLAVTTFIAGLSGMLYAGKETITMFAEFDDKVADVMKTTNLSKDTVYALNEELKKVDTRTAQLELLDLGRVAGKLNIKQKEDVEGFIRASDKVVVALKEDLGGDAEEAVRQIGKLVSVFGITDRFGIEKAITKTGSAINELGMASTANEGYIVNFAKRVAGIAPSARISLQDIMGLAATLDHLGQTSEVSSTAYSQVITGMFKDTEAYAKAAGMSVKSFSKLLHKDANEAFIQLLKGLHNNDRGMEQLIKSMGNLDLEGKRAISVIGVLANNIGILRQQQAISNKEFYKGTSLQEEFNTKNNSAQAILEKKRKVLNNMAIDLGKKLMPVLTTSTSAFTYFVKAMTVIADFAIRNSGALAKLTAAIVAYTIAAKISTMWTNRQTQATLGQIIVTKAKAAAEAAGILITQLYAAATMLFTGNVKGATQAMRVFNTVLKTNTLGILAGVLTLAGTAIYSYWQRTKKVTEEQISQTKETLELQKEKTARVMEEKNALNSLINQIQLTNEKSEIRRNLLKELQEQYPSFLGNLDAEKVTNAELATQLGIVNQSYEQRIKLAALSAKSDAITKVMTSRESRKLEIEEELAKKRTTAVTPGTDLDNEIKALQSEYNVLTQLNKNAEAALRDLDRQITEQKKNTFQNTVDWWSNKVKELDFSIKTTKENIARANKRNDKVSAEHFQRALVNYEAELALAQLQLKSAEERKKEEEKYKKKGSGTFIGGSDEGKKWSLNNDLDYLKASLKLKQQYGKGFIKTEEEYNDKLRNLQIKHLKKRIKSGKEEGETLLEIKQDLADKYIEIRQQRNKREEELQEAANEGISPMDKEYERYQTRLKELKIYRRVFESMTELEQNAFENLTREHKAKLAKIDADNIKSEIDRRQQAFESKLADLQMQHTTELNSIKTLADAKEVLSSTLSNDELQKIRSLEKAKSIIKKQSQIKEEELTRAHMEELLSILQEVSDNGFWADVELSDDILSEEEKQVLIDRINEIKKTLAGLTTGEDDVDPKTPKVRGLSTDILGFSQDDWDIFLQNLDDGTLGISDLIMGVKALGEVWQSYYDSVTAKEQSRLEQFEKSVNSQKATLQTNLDQNLISQEAYNHQVQKLDADLDKKKAEFEYNSAVRSRNIALMSAIVNTANAVTSALGVAPPLGIILASIVGAMGAIQIGTIINTPLPEIPGRESGGYLDVTRQQDGKRFKAKNQPLKRGYVSNPTVITAEKPGSKEYIVSDDGVSNPTIRPVLDILEMARQNGNLATINLPAILESTQTYPGRQQGGYISDSTLLKRKEIPKPSAKDPELLELIRQNNSIMAALKAQLEKPITSTVALHGRKGLYEVMDEDSRLKSNANL